MNGVLESFNRRRRFNRFKYGDCTLDLDRLRFAETASELDEDRHVAKISEKKSKKDNLTGKDSYYSGAICKFYQRKSGCYRAKCIYAHRCIICTKTGHGAITCSLIQRAHEEHTPGRQSTR